MHTSVKVNSLNSDIYKSMLEDVDQVLKIYFTIPVITATAE